MTEYFVPVGPGETEFVEKRSRFLGHLRGVESEEEARAFIEAMKKQYYDARHNCWCYLIRGGAERYSDDGEPQEHGRYPDARGVSPRGRDESRVRGDALFRRRAAGHGGLLRAYTQSARDALDAAGIAAVRQWVQLDVPCPYALLERVKTELAACEGVTEGVDYGAEVLLHALLPEAEAARFADRVFELSAGKLRPTETGRVFRAAAIR